MRYLKQVLAFSFLVIAIFFGIYLWNSSDTKDLLDDDLKKGIHQGRLLENDDFKTEVLLDEGGDVPKFKVYFYENNQAIEPSNVTYKMQLKRLNKIEDLDFEEKNGYLESKQAINEPHSFIVDITARFKEKNYQFEYESYEGIVKLSPDIIDANGIEIEKALPKELEIKISSLGKIVPNEEKTVFIAPRFAGVAKIVYKKLGDIVEEGDVLAVIESNESLKEYEIKAPIKGTIISKNVNPGMYLSGQENIFTLSDLSTIWADFNIYPTDLSLIKVKDHVVIRNLNGEKIESTELFYISPIGDQATQSVITRVLIENKSGLFKPGLYVMADIYAKKKPVKVAVKKQAIQKMFGLDVVFIYVDGVFQATPVVIGAQDDEWIEIISGLEVGQQYVSKNSFLLKADIEKEGAQHEH